MIRVLLYLLLVVMVGAGFAWLANYPGDLVVTVHNTRLATSLLTAFSVFLAVLISIMLLWWLVRSIVLSPVMLKRHWQDRKQYYGYQLLSAGMIAALAGDAVTARRMVRQSSRRLNYCKEPLLPLLEAQTKLLDHDHEGAVKLFEQMRENPQMRLLALKGLFCEAAKSGAAEAANQYAREAAGINPGLKWASLAMLAQLAANGEWDQALILLDRFAKSRPKTAAENEKLLYRRVVLMTGQAQDMAENHPDEARHIALRAHKLQPSFVPAADIAARILFSLKEIRKSSKLVEAMWKVKPHPDLGLTYVNAVQGESAVGRLKRARQLARLNPDDCESRMLVARTALEAGELALARKQVETVAETAPTESTFLLLADIEMAQTADQGRIRHWLARAVRAKPDMAWIADSISLPEWRPISPVTGRLGVCKWKTPTKRIRGVAGRENGIAFRDPAGQAEKPQTLVIDIAASDCAAGKLARMAENMQKAAAAKTVNPLEKPNVDAEPVDDNNSDNRNEDKVSFPVTRIVVDDPGVNDEPKEQDTMNNKFRLF